MSEETASPVTIGIGIGKNTFHLVGLDAEVRIFLRRKMARGQVLVQAANMAPCLIGSIFPVQRFLRRRRFTGIQRS